MKTEKASCFVKSVRRDLMENRVITIARSYGSGGRKMGKLLAKELGFEYYEP